MHRLIRKWHADGGRTLISNSNYPTPIYPSEGAFDENLYGVPSGHILASNAFFPLPFSWSYINGYNRDNNMDPINQYQTLHGFSFGIRQNNHDLPHRYKVFFCLEDSAT